MNGVLVVDKPAGPTSHDVVAVARRALGQTRIGHTGTLDPLATGVLPLVIGQACRLAQYLSGADKEYIASIRFGASTSTYDAEGLDEAGDAPAEPPGLSGAAIEERLDDFRGSYQQIPPPFSAKKIGGVRSYQLARARKAEAIAPVTVTVHALELLSYLAGLARVRVVCSSGFYVRTLANDLGQRLGCGAYVAGLRRVKAGEFTLDHAVRLDVLQADDAAASRHLIAMNALLPFMPAAILTEGGRERASHGGTLGAADFRASPGAASDLASRIRLLDAGGSLVGIAERRPGGLLHPVVVLM
jgi:tRNA pseudouridine55 synthase